MQKPFEDATFATQVGQLSDIVDTDSGVHRESTTKSSVRLFSSLIRTFLTRVNFCPALDPRHHCSHPSHRLNALRA